MKGNTKKIIAILLIVFFLASATAISVSACYCRLESTLFKDNPTLQNICQNKYPYSLHYGSSGEAVKLVQEALMDLGYSLPSGADGYFGWETMDAVMNFQSDHGFSRDGIVGPCTLEALDSAIAHHVSFCSGNPNVSCPDAGYHAQCVNGHWVCVPDDRTKA